MGHSQPSRAMSSALTTIDPSGVEVDKPQRNLLSYYSSMGPSREAEPESRMVAVGTDIYGGPELRSRRRTIQHHTLRAASGTSFSSPWSPARRPGEAEPSQLDAGADRSALISTASRDVTSDDSGDTIDVQWVARANSMPARPSPRPSWPIRRRSPTDFDRRALNVAKAITITNLGSASVTLTAAVVPGLYRQPAEHRALTHARQDQNLTWRRSFGLESDTDGACPGRILQRCGHPQGTGVSLTIPPVSGGRRYSEYNLVFVGSGLRRHCRAATVDPLPVAHSVAVKMTDASGMPLRLPVSWA